MVQINNLTFGYKSRIPLYRDLSISLRTGTIYGLLGENGVGKTTLLKLISGALFPDKGVIRVGDENPSNRHPAFLSDLFLVPETIAMPSQTVNRFVTLNAPFYPKFNRSIFDQYMAEFDIDVSQRLDKLSLGTGKKAYIGFALACQPSLLLMDEPTNGLDIPSKKQFRKLIASFLTDERTVVISTHQVRDLDQLIDHVQILGNGGLLLDEPIDRLERALHFGVITHQEQAIYSEETLRGLVGITPQKGKETSKVDLELLFNAVLCEPEFGKLWITDRER